MGPSGARLTLPAGAARGHRAAATALAVVLLSSLTGPVAANEPPTGQTQTESEWPTLKGVLPTFQLTRPTHTLQRTPYDIKAPGASGKVQLRDGHYAYSDLHTLNAAGEASGLMPFHSGRYTMRAHMTPGEGWVPAISCPRLVEPLLRPTNPRVQPERSVYHVGEIARFAINVFEPSALPDLMGGTDGTLRLRHESGITEWAQDVSFANGGTVVLRQLQRAGRYQVVLELPEHIWAKKESSPVWIDVLPAAGGPFPPLPTAKPGAAPTTVVLHSLPADPWKGDEIRFFATVTPTPSEGLVRIYNGAHEYAGLWQEDGVTFSSSAYTLDGGRHTFRAYYEGSSNHAPSASEVVELNVQSIPTSLSVSVNPQIANPDTSVTVTATVSPAPASGIVYLYQNGEYAGWQAVNPTTGKATWTDTFQPLSDAPLVLSARLEHGGRHADADGFGSLDVRRIPTSISLNAPTSVATAGSFFDATVSVSPVLSGPNPTVRVWSGDRLLKTTNVTSSPAAIPLSLGPGTHRLRAEYSSGMTHAQSWSNERTVVVGPYPNRKPLTGTLVVNNGSPYSNSPIIKVTAHFLEGSNAGGPLMLSNDGENWATFGRIWPHPLEVTWDLTETSCGGKPGDGSRTIYYKWVGGYGDWQDSPVESVEITITQAAGASFMLDRGAPSASAPTLAQSGPVSGNTAPVRLTWSGSDALSGVEAYQLQRSVEGGSWVALGLPSPTATQLNTTVELERDYRFRVRSRDRAGNLSSWQQSQTYRLTNAADTTAPIALPPTQSILGGRKLASSPAISVSWPAASDNVGVVRYELQRRTNLGSWTSVALASPLSLSASVALAPGTNDYRFRVRARDAAGNVSAWATGAVFRLSRVQETNTAISYGGTWKRAALTGASGGYVRFASAAGSTATFKFSGRSIGFATTMGPNRGKAAVWVDGTRVTTLDLYASTSRKAYLVFATDLAPGAHEVRIEVLGQRNASSSSTRVDLDAFLVIR
jgi:hypothetical protein